MESKVAKDVLIVEEHADDPNWEHAVNAAMTSFGGDWEPTAENAKLWESRIREQGWHPRATVRFDAGELPQLPRFYVRRG